MTTKPFDWNKPVTGYGLPGYGERENANQLKAAFHRTARSRLKALAVKLGLAPSSYEIRSNKAGSAVSGEITLHGEAIYVQASQSCMGPDMSLLIRSCKGRKDYTGGHNNFAPLTALDDPKGLAARVRPIMESGK